MDSPYQYALGGDVGDISQQAENVQVHNGGCVAWSKFVLIMRSAMKSLLPTKPQAITTKVRDSSS